MKTPSKRKSILCHSIFSSILYGLIVAAASAQGDTSPDKADMVYQSEFFAKSAPNTAYDMVRRIPGFLIQSGDIVRGYTGAGGNVLIDGARPLTKNDSLETVLRAMPADQVDRIELVRNNQPGLDLQGQQMVVNIIRKTESAAVDSYSISAYAYPDGIFRPSFKYERTDRKGDRGWDASFLISKNQDESGTGKRIRRNIDGVVIDQQRVNVDSPIWGAEGRLSGDIPFAGGSLRATGLLKYQDYDTRERLRSLTIPSLQSVDDQIVTKTGELGIEWSRTVEDNLALTILALGTRIDTGVKSDSYDTLGTSNYHNDSVADEAILRLALDRQIVNRWGWETGGEFTYNRLRSNTDFSQNNIPIQLPNSSMQVSELRGDAFARLKWNPAESLSMETTVRFEVSRILQSDDFSPNSHKQKFKFFKPRQTIRYDVDGQNQIRIRIEREANQLSFNDFSSSASVLEGTISAGNAELRPQTSWDFEAVWERRFSKDGALTAMVRHKRISDVEDLLLIDGLDAPGNIGSGKVNELELQLTLPFDNLGISGGRVAMNGLWRTSSVTDPQTHVKRSISGLPPFEGQINATLDRPKINSTFFMNVHFAQKLSYWRSNEWRQSSAEPYLSIGWTYRPTSRITLETSLQNILFRKRTREIETFDPSRNFPMIYAEDRWYRSRGGLFLSLRFQ